MYILIKDRENPYSENPFSVEFFSYFSQTNNEIKQKVEVKPIYSKVSVFSFKENRKALIVNMYFNLKTALSEASRISDIIKKETGETVTLHPFPISDLSIFFDKLEWKFSFKNLYFAW